MQAPLLPSFVRPEALGIVCGIVYIMAIIVGELPWASSTSLSLVRPRWLA